MRNEFWKDVYMGMVSLCLSFERLFRISEKKDLVVGLMDHWEWMLGIGILGGCVSSGPGKKRSLRSFIGLSLGRLSKVERMPGTGFLSR